MRPSMHVLSALLATGLVIGAGGGLRQGDTDARGSLDEFDEFEVLVEINATDGDAGFQGIVDGEAWDRGVILDPGGRALFQLNPVRNLGDHGVTEVQWESNEPPFTEFSLEDFLELFPEGEYFARATTTEGDRLQSSAELTHDLPAGPVITSPQDGDEVELDGSNVTVTWEEVTDDFRGGTLGSEIVGYVLAVEVELDVGGEEVVRTVEIDVPPDRTQADLPGDFFEPDNEYKIELGAVEESGNRTFSELSFCTVDEDPN